MQGFSNFFIPNLATVHLPVRGHSLPLAAPGPCGRLRVAAPPQAASAACLHLAWAGAGPSGCLPCAAAPQQRHHCRLRRPVRPRSPASQHPCKRGRRGCSPRRHRSLRGRAAGPVQAAHPLPARLLLALASRRALRGSRLALASISAPDTDSAAAQPWPPAGPRAANPEWSRTRRSRAPHARGSCSQNREAGHVGMGRVKGWPRIGLGLLVGLARCRIWVG